MTVTCDVIAFRRLMKSAVTMEDYAKSTQVSADGTVAMLKALSLGQPVQRT